MSKVISFLLTVSMLLYSGNYLNWQGTGNMSQDNMTVISNYIHDNFQESWDYNTAARTGDTRLVNFATGLSDTLNYQWKEAWNVVLAYIINANTNFDSVLYGYAFRDHWVWINGKKTIDNRYFSFIIWKDYNCIKWLTFNNNNADQLYPTSYSSDPSPLKTAIQGLRSNLDKNNPWVAAKTYVDTLQSNPSVKNFLGSSDVAFSVIMSQSIYAVYYGKFCVKDYLVNNDFVGTNGGNWGAALILQMR